MVHQNKIGCWCPRWVKSGNSHREHMLSALRRRIQPVSATPS